MKRFRYIVILFIAITMNISCQKGKSEWNEIKNNKEISSLSAYIKKFPSSIYSDSAKTILNELLYNDIMNLRYMDSYKELITPTLSKKLDSALFNAFLLKKDSKYKDIYLKLFPDGSHADDFFLDASMITSPNIGKFVFSDPKNRYQYTETKLEKDFDRQLNIYQDGKLKAKIEYRNISHVNQFAIGKTTQNIDGESIYIEDYMFQNWDDNNGVQKVKLMSFESWKTGKQFIAYSTEDFINTFIDNFRFGTQNTSKSEEEIVKNKFESINQIKSNYSKIEKLLNDSNSYIKNSFESNTMNLNFISIDIYQKHSTKNVLKITESWNNGPDISGISHYYFYNNELSFVFYKKSSDCLNDCFIEENRYYFHKGKIIKHLFKENNDENAEKDVSMSAYIELSNNLVKRAKSYSDVNSDDGLGELANKLF